MYLCSEFILVKVSMATMQTSKSSTRQGTRIQGSPLVHVERDPAVFGLHRIDEVVPFCIEQIRRNQKDKHLVNKFQNTKNKENFSKGP